MYTSECFRADERLAEANAKLLQERRSSKSLNASGIVSGGLAARLEASVAKVSTLKRCSQLLLKSIHKQGYAFEPKVRIRLKEAFVCVVPRTGTEASLN